MQARPERVLFARHGESLWNAAGRWQGQADPPLSPRGREQARALAASLAAEGVTERVSSPLARARDTAQIVADTLDLPVRFEPRLRERDAGACSGLTVEVVKRRYAAELDGFRSGDPTAALGGGEDTIALRERVLAALADLAGECVVIVSHLGVLRALDRNARLGNASFVELGKRRGAEAASSPGTEAVLL